MHKANRMSRSSISSFFVAIAFVSILVFTPATSGKTVAGPVADGLARRAQDQSQTIGVRRHSISKSSERSVFVSEDTGFFESNLVQSPNAPDVSPNIVISQIYGGGGGSGAPFTHDFIELFNRGTVATNVNGWSVQYAAPGGSTWEVTLLPNVMIQPGQYFLIQQQAPVGAEGDALPTPDASGSINLATTSGKVALVNNTTMLNISCPTGVSIVDFVGYGSSANCSEGLRTLSATTSNSVNRASNGCTDNDLNRYDFFIAQATPRNSLSSQNPCVGPTTGGKIAFISNRSSTGPADTDIFIMNANGTSQTRLTTDPAIEQYPSFSSDGTKILFTRGDKIFVMNVDGSTQTGLTETAGNFEPRFSPNASKIVFSSTRDGNQEIYTMDANGMNPIRITNNPATDRYPVYSPDGTKIAFMSDRDGQSEIYIMNADGTNQVRLTNTPAKDSSAPVFSPDGTKIAFEGFRTETSNNSNIFIMNVNGSNQTRLTSGIEDYAPSFSPDGSAIAFYTTRHGGDNFEVYTMNVDGSNQRNISVALAADLEPSWGVVAGALTVTNVDSPGGSGSFGTGAAIPVTVSFGAPVTVTGTPTLRLATGGAGFPINYTSGSGTAVLTFSYTVQAGHASPDLDYTSTSALVLNGGTINSFGGSPANLTLPAPGAAGSLGANRNIIIDTVAPDTTIVTGPSGTVNSTSATFTFSSNESGTFQCSLDGAAYGACTSGINLTSLSQGSHTFEVRARDLALNVDPTPASRTWIVDTVAPETTIDSGPTGMVSSSSATFSFSSSEVGSTFQCSLNGTAFSSCTSPANYTGLAEGPRTFAVRATDPAGNQDSSAATRGWTVDTVAPDTTINSGPSGPTPSTIASFTFSSNEGGVTFECSLDGAAYSPCSSPAAYGGMSQGPHTFDVRAVDGAGNKDLSPANRAWTADTQAPNTTIDSGPTGTVATTSATFTFSSTESPSTFLCSINGGLTSTCSSPTTYNGLPEGSNTFSVRAVDAAGNQDGSPATRTWTINSSITISGNVKQAPGLTNLSGVTVTLSSCGNAMTTTDGSGNYSFNGVFTGTCTLTPSGLGKFYDRVSRTYTNVSSSIAGADFLAYNSLAEVPRKLRVVNPYVVPGQSAVASVMLASQGNETSVAFTIDYDQTKFTGPPVVACGTGAGAGCNLTTVPGSIGITVIPQAGTFAAGDRQVVTLTFQTQATGVYNTPLTIIGAPTAILIKNAANDPLLAEFLSGFVVYQQGLEADVAGQPTGDGNVFSNDVVVARQIAAGNATVNPAYNEFQRLDSAPAATKGDGQITSGDVIQARNYASGNTTVTSAGGPFQPIPPPAPQEMLTFADHPRSVRIAARSAVAGHTVTVPVEMTAVGNELAVMFTLEYDAMKLSSPAVTLAGVAPADAVLTVNKSESGRLTVLIDSGSPFSSLGGALVNVTFEVAADAAAGDTRIAFASNGSIADAAANELPAGYTNAFLTINGADSDGVEISGRVLTPNGSGLRSARVTITGTDGYQRTVTTSTLGYYSFDGVPIGRIYKVGVNSRQYRFEARTFELTAGLAELNFIGLE